MLSFTFLHGDRSLRRAAQFLAAAALMSGCAMAQVGLGLAPMREELALEPGAAHSGVLMLSNSSTDKVRVAA